MDATTHNALSIIPRQHQGSILNSIIEMMMKAWRNNTTGLLLVAALGFTNQVALAADEDAIKQCAQEKVAFDGIKPLKYADIVGEANSHIPLLHQHPALCALADDRQCKDKAYLVPGDTVAVANTCGEYAHVQYIGEKTVSYGWVKVDHLKERSESSISSSSNTSAAGQSSEQQMQHYQFKLTRGHGVPVCEAYLQRLNKTEFAYPAYCGRMENDAVPGFAYLNRVPVPTKEINELIEWVAAIKNPLTGIDSNYYESMNRNGGVFTGPPSHIEFRFADNIVLSSWRYAPAVDIDNDGEPDNVLIFDTVDAKFPNCVSYIGNNASPDRNGQIAFAMTPDGKLIDQAKTIQIFGHPDGGFQTVPGTKGKSGEVKFVKSFRLIGNSYGLFEYRDTYYFDMFFDSMYAYGGLDKDWLGDFEDKRIGDPTLKDTLGVFLRKDNKTQQICEYHVTE
ncbi:MAG: hypothetical protein ABUL58_02295 [Steroidobacter sp.]